MIKLELSSIMVIFVVVPLIAIAVCALYYSLRSMHRSSRDKESIYKCADCGHVYAFARNRPMDRCPRCGYLNEAVRT